MPDEIAPIPGQARIRDPRFGDQLIGTDSLADRRGASNADNAGSNPARSSNFGAECKAWSDEPFKLVLVGSTPTGATNLGLLVQWLGSLALNQCNQRSNRWQPTNFGSECWIQFRLVNATSGST